MPGDFQQPGPELEPRGNTSPEQGPTRLRDVPAGRWALLVVNVCLLVVCVSLTATSPLAPWRAVPPTPPPIATATVPATAPTFTGTTAPAATHTPTPSGSGGGPAPTATHAPTATPRRTPTATPKPVTPTPTNTPSQGN